MKQMISCYKIKKKLSKEELFEFKRGRQKKSRSSDQQFENIIKEVQFKRQIFSQGVQREKQKRRQVSRYYEQRKKIIPPELIDQKSFIASTLYEKLFKRYRIKNLCTESILQLNTNDCNNLQQRNDEIKLKKTKVHTQAVQSVGQSRGKQNFVKKEKWQLYLGQQQKNCLFYGKQLKMGKQFRKKYFNQEKLKQFKKYMKNRHKYRPIYGSLYIDKDDDQKQLVFKDEINHSKSTKNIQRFQNIRSL